MTPYSTKPHTGHVRGTESTSAMQNLQYLLFGASGVGGLGSFSIVPATIIKSPPRKIVMPRTPVTNTKKIPNPRIMKPLTMRAGHMLAL